MLLDPVALFSLTLGKVFKGVITHITDWYSNQRNIVKGKERCMGYCRTFPIRFCCGYGSICTLSLDESGYQL